MGIKPGGHVPLEWSPHVYFPVEIADTCGFAPDGTCAASRRATPGAYTMSISYSHAGECEGMCTCFADANGSCKLDLEEVTLPPGSGVEVSAAYDGVCPTIDLVLE